MSYLIDTNVLLRSAQPSHSMHADAARAVGELFAQGEILSVIPQNIIEYWAVVTRPVEANGLGMSVVETVVEVSRLKGIF
jgi:predicted nucleic acid-binding protein